MSTFQALALLLGAAISTVYVLIRIQGATRSLSAMIVTGVEDGLPVSIEYRSLMFWMNFLAAGMYAIFLNVLGGRRLFAVFWALGMLNSSILLGSTLKKASRN